MSQLCNLLVPHTPQSNQEQSLQQKLLDEQFIILQQTVREAEDILRDAVAKLDDPLHIRCTSSPGTSCLTVGPATQITLPLGFPQAFFPYQILHPRRLGSDFPGMNF